MSQRTKRILLIVALAVAAAWFALLRGQAGELFGGSAPAYRGPVDALERIEGAQALPYSPAELRILFGPPAGMPGEAPGGEVPVAAPDTAQPGETSGFWVSDGVAGEAYRVTATLRYAGQHTLLYVDQNVEVDQQALEQAARDFETRILPQTRALFGPETSPGIDGDPRLTILHTPLASAGGYFSLADTEPLEFNRFSNQREMFVIGSDSYLPGDEGYLMILAHELQHMIHAGRQPNSPAWFNEGLSMLAQDLNGYVDDELALVYLANPDLGLTDWAQDASETGEHYGAAQLFLRYFYEQYGGASVLSELLRAGAGDHPQAFSRLAAETCPDIHTFTDLVADWAVANLVNDASLSDGRYAYDGLPATVAPQEFSGRLRASLNQLGVDYLELGAGPRRLEFDGEDAVALTGARPKQGDWMWWSGRGDARVSTLTRAFDLRGVQQATLQFSAWYELERHFDYAYVTVSVDSGQTWQTLPGQATHRADPQGANLGDGLTGVSGRPGIDPEQGQRGRWVRERMNLSPYVGKQILLRFWVVNDPAYNAQGLLLDELRIPEIGYHDGGEDGEGGWLAQGFVRTPGGIRQEWALRLVVETASGVEVRKVALDERNRAVLELAPGERGALVVIAASPVTDEPARYRLI